MCTPASREARCGQTSGSPLTKVGARNSFRPADVEGDFERGRGRNAPSRGPATPVAEARRRDKLRLPGKDPRARAPQRNESLPKLSSGLRADRATWGDGGGSKGRRDLRGLMPCGPFEGQILSIRGER